MKETTIKFKGDNYTIQTGEVFQVNASNNKVGTIFLVQSNPNEKVYLEVLERPSSEVCIVRVNEIQWEEDGKVNVENYKGAVIESNDEIISLEDMTKKELIEFILKNNLDINIRLKKSELLDAIKSMI